MITLEGVLGLVRTEEEQYVASRVLFICLGAGNTGVFSLCKFSELNTNYTCNFLYACLKWGQRLKMIERKMSHLITHKALSTFIWAYILSSILWLITKLWKHLKKGTKGEKKDCSEAEDGTYCL